MQYARNIDGTLPGTIIAYFYRRSKFLKLLVFFPHARHRNGMQIINRKKFALRCGGFL